MKYKLLDHTGDLRVLIYGNNYKSLFENALYAMTNLITDTSKLTENKIKGIKILKRNYDDLMISFLNDILFYLETDGILYYDSDIIIKNNELTGTIYGSIIPDNVEYEYVIKAPTYYNLEIKPENNYAIIVLDI